MSRRANREELFKLLFQSTVRNIKLKDLLDIDEVESKFIKRYIKNISENINNINEIVSKSLKDWNIEHLGNVEKSIINLAIYEIFYEEEINEKIAINEAVELAKKYGENSSAKFINGILATVVLKKNDILAEKILKKSYDIKESNENLCEKDEENLKKDFEDGFKESDQKKIDIKNNESEIV